MAGAVHELTSPLAAQLAADDIGAFSLAGLLYLGAAMAVVPVLGRARPSKVTVRRAAPRLAIAVIVGGAVGPVLGLTLVLLGLLDGVHDASQRGVSRGGAGDHLEDATDVHPVDRSAHVVLHLVAPCFVRIERHGHEDSSALITDEGGGESQLGHGPIVARTPTPWLSGGSRVARSDRVRRPSYVSDDETEVS